MGPLAARSPHRALLLGCLVTALTGACRRSESPAPPPPEDQLVVFAAASLREAFTAVGAELERQHPGVHVRFNFAGSQELRTQLEHGALADIFASADQRQMEAVARAGRVGEPVLFARNRLVLVVARESAEKLRSLADLPRAERIVLGAPEVPVGRYSEQLLDRASERLGADFRARVEAKVVSRELNVRQVLAKVRLGEAQAGLVYQTDAQAAQGSPDGELTVLPLPEGLDTPADYPIAQVTGAPHPGLARAWLELLLSPTGGRALSAAGFLLPTASAPVP